MAISPRSVGVVGAAIAGPVFALQILSHPVLRKRLKPIIFEQLDQPEKMNSAVDGNLVHTAGAGVGLFPNGLFPLYELGLRDQLHSISSHSPRLSIWRGGLDGSSTHRNTLINATWDADLQTGARAVERRRLRSLLLQHFQNLGGKIHWGKKVQSIKNRENGRVNVTFANGEATEVDLLIGSDGAWSQVRKYILDQRNDAAAATKIWVPSFTGISGIYGISSGLDFPLIDGEIEPPLVYLPRGNISYLPLKDGKIAWTLHIPEEAAPQRSTPIPISESDSIADPYMSKMVPGVYEPHATAEILRRHEDIHHPTLGTWKPIFEASERILRSPLRLKAWKADQIQWGNIAVIGDAARTLPPFSGQGASMAIEDATVLADSLLNNLPLDNDCNSFRGALEEYARRRVPRSEKVAKMAAWSGTLTMGERWYWRWIRDIGARLPAGGDRKESVYVSSFNHVHSFKSN